MRSYALFPFEFLCSTLYAGLGVYNAIAFLYVMVLFAAGVITDKRPAVTVPALNDRDVGTVAERADGVLMERVQKVVYQETHICSLTL